MIASTIQSRLSAVVQVSQVFLSIVLLACTLSPLSADSTAKAATKLVPIAGTQVSLTQPAGFVTATDFPGFVQKATYSSVMVTELPAPFAQVTAGFTQTLLAGRGMTLLSRQARPFDGSSGLLLHVKQEASGIIFEKWIYTFGDAKQTILVTATFPQAQAPKLSSPLEATVLSARWDRAKAVDPFSDLRFHITARIPLRFTERIGSMLLFSGDPQNSSGLTMFGAGYALSDIGVVDQKQFALKRLSEEPVTDQTVLSTTPVVIDGLHGYENTATGHEKRSKAAVTLYQVILFDGKTYFLMFGITPTDQASQTLPVFRAMSASLTLTGHTP
jgi:hypothetical protein